MDDRLINEMQLIQEMVMDEAREGLPRHGKGGQAFLLRCQASPSPRQNELANPGRAGFSWMCAGIGSELGVAGQCGAAGCGGVSLLKLQNPHLQELIPQGEYFQHFDWTLVPEHDLLSYLESARWRAINQNSFCPAVSSCSFQRARNSSSSRAILCRSRK